MFSRFAGSGVNSQLMLGKRRGTHWMSCHFITKWIRRDTFNQQSNLKSPINSFNLVIHKSPLGKHLGYNQRANALAEMPKQRSSSSLMADERKWLVMPWVWRTKFLSKFSLCQSQLGRDWSVCNCFSLICFNTDKNVSLDMVNKSSVAALLASLHKYM